MATGEGLTTIIDTQTMVLASAPASFAANRIFHVASNTYALFYRVVTTGSVGIVSLTISAAGAITTTPLDETTIGGITGNFSTSQYIEQVHPNWFVLTQIGTVAGNADIRSINITDAGTITTNVDTEDLGFATSGPRGVVHKFATVSGKARCLAIIQPTSGNDKAVVFDVDTAGTITIITAATALPDAGLTKGVTRVRDDIVLAYRGRANVQELYTFKIADDGTITATTLDTESVATAASNSFGHLLATRPADGQAWLTCSPEPTGSTRTQIESRIDVDADGLITEVNFINSTLVGTFAGGSAQLISDNIFIRETLTASTTGITTQLANVDGTITSIAGNASFISTPSGNVAYVKISSTIFARTYAEFASNGSVYIETFDMESSVAVGLSGTIFNANEEDIRTGGKTLLITLTGLVWNADIGSSNTQTTALINGLDSAQAEGTGCDAVVKAGLTFSDITRNSDSVVTILFPAFATYEITAAEIVTATIESTSAS